MTRVRHIAEDCLDHAERAGFSGAAAAQIVVEALSEAKLRGQNGVSSEDLVDRCKDAGLVPHDDRCFGGVFLSLARSGEIRRVGYTNRRKGNGTGGASLWVLA